MAEEEVMVAPEELRRFAADVLVAGGMTREGAATEAAALVWANQRGVDTHGVIRLERYLEMFAQDESNPQPKITVISDTPAVCVLDADKGFGPLVLPQAMDRAIAKARTVGFGWCLVRRSAHAGAIGMFVRRAAEQGFVGIAMTCGVPTQMGYPGAKGVAALPTAPLAIAVPVEGHAPLVLDMASAVVAGGNLRERRVTGEPLEPGWAIDADGNPTTDPKKATVPLPLGGFKGAGLAMAIECMAGLMVGNPTITPAITGKPGGNMHNQNALVGAIDPAVFGDAAEYKKNTAALIDAVKALPKGAGTTEITVPGERGDAVYEERGRTGIPVAAAIWKQMEKVAKPLGVAMPSPLPPPARGRERVGVER
jgi:ureidoglycolate dehydrogenase (NAD+)